MPSSSERAGVFERVFDDAGRPLSIRPTTATPAPRGRPGEGAGEAGAWLKGGWDGSDAASEESARILARLSLEDLARLKKFLGPFGKGVGIAAVTLDALERYANHEPLDEIAVRELARFGLAEVGATAGGRFGGFVGAFGGPAAPFTVPAAAAAGAIGGGLAGDRLGDGIGDLYANRRSIPGHLRQFRQDVERSLHDGVQNLVDPHTPPYDDSGRPIHWPPNRRW